MKRAILKSDYSELETLIGFAQNYLWKSTKYVESPRVSGRYLTVNSAGKIRELMCVGQMDDSKKLFEIAANDTGLCDEAYIDGRRMLDSDLMDIYRSPWGLWWEATEWQEYDDSGTIINVYTKESPKFPLYFLDMNLDSVFELDENQEMKATEPPVYYHYDKVPGES